MKIVVSIPCNIILFLFSFWNGLGKTADVGGCFPQEFGATRPSFQHQTPESQKVSNLEILLSWPGPWCRTRAKSPFNMCSFLDSTSV